MARGKSRGRGVHGPNRQNQQSDDGGGQRWLSTYSDMVTLLLAFFVILFSMSSIEIEDFESFLRGLESPFGNPAYSESLLDGSPAIVGQDFAGRDEDLAADRDDGDEDIEDEEIIVSTEGLRDTRDQIQDALEDAGFGDVAEYDIDHRGLVLTLGTDSVLFATGSTQISAQGARILDAIAPVLNQIPNELRVEGHTDSVPLNRAGYTNWNLSTDRAVAVLNMLDQGHGIDPTRLAATGYGEYRPRATNETGQGRAQNRRVEIIVVVPGDN